MGGLFDSVIMGAALVGEHTVSDWQRWACRPDGRGRGCRIDASGRGDLYFIITTRTNTFQEPMLHFLLPPCLFIHTQMMTLLSSKQC